MYTTLVKNRVCRGSNGFLCTLCDVEIADEENASKHVTNNKKHLDNIESAALLKSVKIDENKSIELVNNGIVPVSSRDYQCTFCPCSIPKLDHISEHITGKKHITKRRKILPDSDFCDLANLVTSDDQDKSTEDLSSDESSSDQCKTTGEPSSSIPSDRQNKNNEEPSYNVPSDKQNHNKEPCSIVPSNGQAKNNEEIYSDKPCIPKITPVYCNSCKSNLESNSAFLYHRMFHLSQRTCHITDIINFTIKDNTKNIYCLICDYIMKNEDDLEKHLKGVGHQKRLIIVCCPNNGAIMNMMYLNSAFYSNIAIPPNMNNIYNTLNAEFNRYLYYLGCNIYCSTFPMAVQNNYMNDKFRQYQSSTNTSIAQLQQNEQQNINNSICPAYFCFICNMKFIDENLLFLHYNYDYVHKYRMEAINLVLRDKNMQFVNYANNEVIKCLKCQIQLTELNGAVTHLFEMQHIMEKQAKNEKTVSNNTILINNANVPRNMYVCPICKINVTHDYMMVQHLESEYHRNRVQEYYANINCGSFEKIIFFCPLCKTNFFNDRTFLEHFYHRHENKFKNVIQTNNIMLANSAGMYLTANNSFINGAVNQEMQQYCDAKYKNLNSIPFNDVNYTLNNLVNLNLDKNHHPSLGSGMNKQKIAFNQDNDYATSKTRTKNLINFSPRYVKLCVEIGDENIFKINTEKIKRLQLGIQLTFPYESNRGCIPCGYEISSDPQCLYEHLRTEEHERNLQEMEENDEFFENYHDQFSDLELAKSYMYEDSDEWVKCIACDIKVKNCNQSIRSHINSEPHTTNFQSYKNSGDEIFRLFDNMFENIWYYIEKYFCNICSAQFEFEVDYARHLENPKHLKEVEKRILRKQSLQFDCCILCSSYWYAKSDHHTIHCGRDSHKYILKSRDFTVPEMTDLAKKLLTSVEETVEDSLIESNKAILSTEATEKQLLESVEMVVKSKYPQAKAYLFGSRISYLGFQDSDLDIFLDCENQYEKLKSIDESQEELITVQECFHKYQDIWVIEEIIVRTRVPIIKLRHRSTNLNCDISFINGLSVEKSKILGYYVNACLPCRKLILYLKKWNTFCRLSGPKGITTFAISWFVIFYLQIQGILPSVQFLIELQNQSNIVAGWETGVSKEISVKKIDLSIKDLLKGFFSYYAKFNYISDVVCPFLGKIMKKSQFSNIDDLPEEMNIYKTQIKEENTEFFRLDSPMCIQDPIDLSQNITKAVTKLHLRMFKQYCVESAASLQT